MGLIPNHTTPKAMSLDTNKQGIEKWLIEVLKSYDSKMSKVENAGRHKMRKWEAKLELQEALLKWADEQRVEQEHYAKAISANGGTTSQCVCGKIFATTTELQGHINWNLAKLKTLTGGELEG